MPNAVAKAVIPAAGLGTRMLPLTKAVPKEMLPAGRKPMIQYVVEEAVASGIKQICIVIRQGKEIIRDFFMQKYPYSGKSGKGIRELESLLSRCELTFVYQKHQYGLGDALLQTTEFVGQEPFVMMVPDQLLHSTEPATLQLLRRWRPGESIWSSMLRISKAEAPFFIGSRGFEYSHTRDPDQYVITALYEEEEIQLRYADLEYEVRGFGRTVYPPEIFNYLGKEFLNPLTGEVDLLKTFQACVKDVAHYGVLLEGESFDLGTWEGYYRYLPRLWDLEK